MSKQDLINETSDPIVRLGDVTALADAGHLPSRYYLEARHLLIDKTTWRILTSYALLAFAVAHLLVGITFFFAFNWATLPIWAKLGLPQIGLIFCLLVWWRLKLDTRSAQASGIAANVFLGLLMAVFGQVYQTGADAYELFVGWAALALPLVIAARSWAHWLFWVLLANIAAFTFVEGSPALGFLIETQYALIIGFGNLAGGMILYHRREKWIAPRWVIYPILVWAKIILIGTGLLGLFDHGRLHDDLDIDYQLVLPPLIAVAILHIYSRKRRGDFALFAETGFGLMIFAVAITIRLSIFVIDWENALLYISWGLLVPGIIGGSIVYFRRVWSSWDGPNDG